jgi:glycosyltransferase involved in cell wall biosynthesis
MNPAAGFSRRESRGEQDPPRHSSELCALCALCGEKNDHRGHRGHRDATRSATILRVMNAPRRVKASVIDLLPAMAIVARTLAGATAGRLRLAGELLARRKRRLRLGVDIRPFYEPLTGVGWYLYHLLHEIAKADDVDLFLFGDARLTGEGPYLHADLPPRAVLCTFDLRGVAPSPLTRPLTAGAYVLWMQLLHCDLCFGANYFLPRLMAAAARRRVVTVHDLTYKRFPELLQRETLENLERQMLREIAIADAVIAVSEATRSDLLASYSIDPRRVVTIHSGIAPAPTAREPRQPLPDRYILFVSTIEPRKNLPLLLGAFEALKGRGAYDGALVIVGKVGWKADEVMARMRKSRWTGEIHHLDYLDAAELATVYQRAEMFVFPSIYEGFGFPLLEAMRHGVPTIAARTSSLPEVGGDATIYFDPGSEAELATAIDRVAGDPALRSALARKGRQRVELFQWSRAAAETLALFRRVAGMS